MMSKYPICPFGGVGVPASGARGCIRGSEASVECIRRCGDKEKTRLINSKKHGCKIGEYLWGYVFNAVTKVIE